MKRVFLLAALAIAFLFLLPKKIYSRSGCCSHHGGVCGCGCCDGSPLSSTCAPYYPECSRPVYIAPTAAKVPVPTNTPILTTPTAPKPTITPTLVPTQTPTLTPTAEPEVKSAFTKSDLIPTLQPEKAELSTKDIFAVLGLFSFMGGIIWVSLKLYKRVKSFINK